MGSLVTVLASAFVLVAPADWTAAPADPPLEEVVVFWWAEDEAGQYLPAIPSTPGYVAAGARLVLDTSGVPTGQTICIRAWAVGAGFYTEASKVCAPNGDGLAPVWIVPP